MMAPMKGNIEYGSFVLASKEDKESAMQTEYDDTVSDSGIRQ